MNVQWNVRFAGRHATRMLLRSGTCWWKPRDVGLDHVPSETADHKRSRNEFAPVLQSLVSDTPVPCPWVRSIIIVATNTGDSDP